MSADPVISDAVWRAYREGVIRSDVYLDPSDRESAGLRAAITQWLAEQQAGPHVYLSTGCYHGRHDYCAAMTGMRGEKRPARCKWCEARCECDCHSCPTCSGPVRETVGMICQTCGTDYSAPAVAGAPEAPSKDQKRIEENS